MPRKELAKINGQRAIYTARFERCGSKAGHGNEEKTILLVDVRTEAGEFITDHLWFNFTKGFAAIDLTSGDFVKFHARVSRYQAGYQGHREEIYNPSRTNYGLSFPTQIEKLEEAPQAAQVEPLPPKIERTRKEQLRRLRRRHKKAEQRKTKVLAKLEIYTDELNPRRGMKRLKRLTTELAEVEAALDAINVQIGSLESQSL